LSEAKPGSGDEGRTIVPGYRFAHPGYRAPSSIVMHPAFSTAGFI
jgi:hypothetical protein